MSNPPRTRRPFIERTSSALLFLVVIFGIGIGVGVILGKLRPPIQLSPTTAQVILKPSTDPSTFAVGDRVEIVFTGIAGPDVKTAKTFTVDEKGTIPIPLIGALEMKGHTAAQAQQAIARAYRDRNLVDNMQVEIRRLSPSATAPAAKP